MQAKTPPKLESTLSGVAGQYFVAAELSRRGYIATATLRNTRGVDILASNADGTKAITIQVKTNQGSKAAWMLSEKAETLVSDFLFYVFVNLHGRGGTPTYHVVGSGVVATYISKSHQDWKATPNLDGGKHRASSIRIFKDAASEYLGKWESLGLS